MRDYLRLYINGKREDVYGDAAFMMLSEYLRRQKGLTGTKVVCAEGDCGSCTALVGRVVDGAIEYTTVNACIQQMLQLDGTHVVTVEGLNGSAAKADQVNVLQQSMVDCHGAQCGFCTPGFVVTLYDLMVRGKDVESEKNGQNFAQDNGHQNGCAQSCSEHEVRRGLTGNLCRCTGYDSIVQAAMATDVSQLASLDALYPPKAMAADLVGVLDEPVLLKAHDAYATQGEKQVFMPRTVEQATAYLAEHVDDEKLTIMSGGTDLNVVQNKGRLRVEHAMVTGGIDAMQALTVEEDEAGRVVMVIGGGVSLERVKDLSKQYLPAFDEYLEWFGSPMIRHAGTLAGNVCTASPIGDTPPVLYAMGAEIELTSINGDALSTRRMLVEDFHTGYRTTQRQANELVTKFYLPTLGPDEQLKLYKVSRRKDMDISSFSAAIWLKLDTAGEVIEDIRIAYGGVAATVVRVAVAEDYLRGGALTLDRFAEAGRLARESVTPMSDVRGEAAYRSTLAENIMVKLWHELMEATSEPSSTLANAGGG